MGNKKATGFLCLRLVPCFAYVGAEDNRKGIPFVKIVSLLCKLIQFLMVALSVTVHKALILLVFLNHPYQSLAFASFQALPCFGQYLCFAASGTTGAPPAVILPAGSSGQNVDASQKLGRLTLTVDTNVRLAAGATIELWGVPA